MSAVLIPSTYQTGLDIRETERAIKGLKDFFEDHLAAALNLTRVTAPLFVSRASGLNDNLNGVERPVAFKTKELQGEIFEIVHSLAKWKRLALYKYGFSAGEGLYTDMNAIRRDEDLSAIHSLYVDQWDWEKVINQHERTIEHLKTTVRSIYGVLRATEAHVHERYPTILPCLPTEIKFITSQELEDRYPTFSAKEREHVIAQEAGAVFIMQIGKTMRSGQIHDGRAPDYDDWSLNGDIIVWNPVLESALELSSMGIRVDSASMAKQLALAGCQERQAYSFHHMVLSGELPLTMGGGIGQSRLCMFFLRKAHIGEVQASVWPEWMQEQCRKSKVKLL